MKPLYKNLQTRFYIPVFQPIIVRKSAVKGYEIIAGERRFRASKLAGKEKFPQLFANLMKNP